MAYKMKGSPMKRNFGISDSPLEQEKEGSFFDRLKDAAKEYRASKGGWDMIPMGQKAFGVLKKGAEDFTDWKERIDSEDRYTLDTRPTGSTSGHSILSKQTKQ